MKLLRDSENNFFCVLNFFCNYSLFSLFADDAKKVF